MPPEHDPDVWLFDLDNTLYPARCNLFAQVDVRIGRYIARWLNIDVEEARRLQKQYWREHGTSMRGINEVTSAIASAVEQQGMATKEISENAQMAAQVNESLAANIA